MSHVINHHLAYKGRLPLDIIILIILALIAIFLDRHRASSSGNLMLSRERAPYPSHKSASSATLVSKSTSDSSPRLTQSVKRELAQISAQKGISLSEIAAAYELSKSDVKYRRYCDCHAISKDQSIRLATEITNPDNVETFERRQAWYRSDPTVPTDFLTRYPNHRTRFYLTRVVNIDQSSSSTDANRNNHDELWIEQLDLTAEQVDELLVLLCCDNLSNLREWTPVAHRGGGDLGSMRQSTDHCGLVERKLELGLGAA